MYIDSHCHLFYEDFSDDIGEVIARAQSAGVTKFVVPATNHETALQAITLAEKYPSVFVCVGFHPLDLEHYSESNFAALQLRITHPKVVAIGEIGIDYFYDTSPRDYQKKIFSHQIDFAIEKNLPIVVHTRDSMDDAIKIVVDKVQRNTEWKKDGYRGVFHCFTGNAEQAKILINHQFLVSFPGPVTFKKNDVMAQTLVEIGIEHIMLETDAPFLTPAPLRGKRNEPSYIPVIAKKIAEITSLPIDEVTRISTRNAESLFKLS